MSPGSNFAVKGLWTCRTRTPAAVTSSHVADFSPLFLELPLPLIWWLSESERQTSVCRVEEERAKKEMENVKKTNGEGRGRGDKDGKRAGGERE